MSTSGVKVAAADITLIAQAIIQQDFTGITQGTIPLESIGGTILARFFSDFVTNPGYWTIFETDGTTEFKRIPISQATGVDTVTAVAGENAT